MSARAGGAAIAVIAIPIVTLAATVMMLGGAASNASPLSSVCGGGGTAARIGSVTLGAEQLGNAHTIVTVTAGRRLPVFAAVVAVDAAYTESGLHNTTIQTDHDSEGLFQQRVSIYTAAVAANPVAATGAFLDRLTAIPDWQNRSAGDDAQTVQRSAYPDRYQPNVALAQAIVGRFWPAAAAADRPTEATTAADGTAHGGSNPNPKHGALESEAGAARPAVCAGAGGAAPVGGITGPTGGNVAGTTSIPAGFVITGSAKGYLAVRYALAELGKPYVLGAAGPDAFDCSGLTMAAWAAAGIALPHLAAAQTSAGAPEPTDLSEAVGGDLVFIAGSDGTPAQPGHVGMIAGYVDRPDGRRLYLIQAPETGVPVELTQASEWSGQIVAVRHIA